MKKKKRITPVILTIVILVLLAPAILREILTLTAKNDPWHTMQNGVIINRNDYDEIVVDTGMPECDYKIMLNQAVCFNRFGLPCSRGKLQEGTSITFYSGSTVVYDETNYEERGEKRTDTVADVIFVWINR